MKNQSLLSALDPELVKHLTSRRDLLFNVGRAAAPYASVPVAIGMLSTKVFGEDLPQNIVDVLNFALTLEFLEDEHYKAGLGKSGLIPSEDRKVFETISKHETAHVELLKKVIGNKAVAKPELDPTAGGAFPDALSNYQTYLALSQAFEDTGVRAYKGQAGNLMSNPKLLTVALQIHSVEARHASEMRRMRAQKGWISADSRGTLPAATQAIYDGEANTMQGAVEIAGLFGGAMGMAASSSGSNMQNGSTGLNAAEQMPQSDKPMQDKEMKDKAMNDKMMKEKMATGMGAGMVSVPASAYSEAFDEPLTKEQVLAIVKPFIKS
ncbi:MAG TPA: ferritin-like domain-containing protein [Terriglobales bacterium]|nr:ferritin-like domain-containing protein [Terriglobales bacterium]